MPLFSPIPLVMAPLIWWLQLLLGPRDCLPWEEASSRFPRSFTPIFTAAAR